MKNLKQKLRDLCWYKTCYADGLREKDREPYANAMADEIWKLFGREIIKDIKHAQKKWIPCNDKNCGNRDECEIANFYIETIWNPTFEQLKQKLT